MYNTGLLKDIQGMTVESPKRSVSRSQGLLYSQFYSSQKEIFDAAKTYPFMNQAVKNLALDSQI